MDALTWTVPAVNRSFYNPRWHVFGFTQRVWKILCEGKFSACLIKQQVLKTWLEWILNWTHNLDTRWRYVMYRTSRPFKNDPPPPPHGPFSCAEGTRPTPGGRALNQLWLVCHLIWSFSDCMSIWADKCRSETKVTEFLMPQCSRITSTKSPSFWVMTSSTCLTPAPVTWMQLLRKQTKNLAPPLLWFQKHTDIRAHDLAHSPGLVTWA
jgi:hypothetical protein